VELQETLNRMQRSHSVGFRVRQEEGRDGVLMVLHREHVPQAAADVAKMRTLLGLKPDASQFSVTLGELPRNDRELAINTRSMLELMQELGAGIVVPPEHQRKARMLRDASTDPNELTQSDTYRPLVEIKSGRTPPAETYAAVQYKGYWFWIDDEDDRTKRLFTFLMILFSLSETSPPMSNPVLSINTGR
jgi:hypothetical protein